MRADFLSKIFNQTRPACEQAHAAESPCLSDTTLTNELNGIDVQ